MASTDGTFSIDGTFDPYRSVERERAIREFLYKEIAPISSLSMRSPTTPGPGYFTIDGRWRPVIEPPGSYAYTEPVFSSFAGPITDPTAATSFTISLPATGPLEYGEIVYPLATLTSAEEDPRPPFSLLWTLGAASVVGDGLGAMWACRDSAALEALLLKYGKEPVNVYAAHRYAVHAERGTIVLYDHDSDETPRPTKEMPIVDVRHYYISLNPPSVGSYYLVGAGYSPDLALWLRNPTPVSPLRSAVGVTLAKASMAAVGTSLWAEAK